MKIEYRWDNLFDATVVLDDTHEIAGLDTSEPDNILVSYGTAYQEWRTFPNLEAAQAWIENHAHDLADPRHRDLQ